MIYVGIAAVWFISNHYIEKWHMEDTKDQPPNRTGEWGDDFIPHWRTYCRKRLLDIITVILVILAAILG